MNTKKSAKVEEIVAKPSPAAAKPLSKAAPVKAAKPVEKAPAAKKPEPVAVKVVKEVKVAKEEKVAKEAKVVKKPKPKVVRDSFTMPQSEYQKIAQIKEMGLKAGLQVKKSEVLRAGVIALCAMNEAQLKTALSSLDKIKTGRPNKH
jgi:3-deoxy-D-arabino-heptulosonate 7-phosphate (DAHP) synthase